nr:11518_t:CDS:2 [Entrophospora candida]
MTSLFTSINNSPLDVNNGVTERANSTKVLCKFKNSKRFTNVKAAIKRDSVISAVGEVGNRQNNLVILISTNTKSVLSAGSSVSRLENISNSVIWDLQSITPKLKQKADIQTKYAKQLSKEGIDTFCQLLLHATISCRWSFNWVEDQKLLKEEVWFGVVTIFQLKDKEKLGAMNTLKLG